MTLSCSRAARDRAPGGYYDGRIWAIAKLAQIAIVLGEDFASGSILEGAEFLDPFADALDVGTL